MAAPMSRIAVLMLLSILCVTYAVLAQGHSHDHDHAHSYEAPHSKYSKEANEGPGAPPQHAHSHTADSHAHSHGHGEESREPPSQKAGKAKPQAQDTFTMWVEALVATAIVSAAPVVILIFIPLSNASEHQSLLKVLLSFASGGLLGDAFLHLIPHAVNPHSHGGEDGGHGHSHESHGHSDESHGHSHAHSHEMGVGLWVLAGIVAFLMVEKFVRYVKGGHGHSHGKPSKKAPEPSTSKTQQTGKKGNPSYLEELKKGKGEKDGKGKGDVVKAESAANTGKKGNPKYLQELKASGKGKGVESTGDIKVAGYLNLAADFAHNFTDGLAIGASFLAGRNIGIITTITILLHEVPHEIGDFAILVQSGCSKKKAMWLQLTTAIGAMMGTLCSLMAQGIGDAAIAWILPFTAGGFIYIATVSVIPELLEDSKPWQSVKEIFALLTGVFMMVLIAMYE